MREQSPGFKKEFDVSEYCPEMYGFDQRRPLKLYDIVELEGKNEEKLKVQKRVRKYFITEWRVEQRGCFGTGRKES